MHSPFLPGRHDHGAGRPAEVAAARSIERVLPVPREKWPAWAKVLALARANTDAGIGDTVVTVIGKSSSDAFKRWFETRFGKSCGCCERQAWLNRRFPYVLTSTPGGPKKA